MFLISFQQTLAACAHHTRGPKIVRSNDGAVRIFIRIHVYDKYSYLFVWIYFFFFTDNDQLTYDVSGEFWKVRDFSNFRPCRVLVRPKPVLGCKFFVFFFFFQIACSPHQNFVWKIRFFSGAAAAIVREQWFFGRPGRVSVLIFFRIRGLGLGSEHVSHKNIRFRFWDGRGFFFSFRLQSLEFWPRAVPATYLGTS